MVYIDDSKTIFAQLSTLNPIFFKELEEEFEGNKLESYRKLNYLLNKEKFNLIGLKKI